MVMQREAPAPAVAAIGLRLLDRVDDLAAELTEVIRRAEPFYAGSSVVAVDDLRASVRDNLIHILGQLCGQPRSGLEPPRVTGQRRAEQGVPLPVILHAYRVAGKFIWAAILAEAAGDEVATTALLEAGSELWLIIDTHSGSVTDAYRDTIAERAHSDSQTRHAGQPGAGPVRAGADRRTAGRRAGRRRRGGPGDPRAGARATGR